MDTTRQTTLEAPLVMLTMFPLVYGLGRLTKLSFQASRRVHCPAPL